MYCRCMSFNMFILHYYLLPVSDLYQLNLDCAGIADHSVIHGFGDIITETIQSIPILEK